MYFLNIYISQLIWELICLWKVLGIYSPMYWNKKNYKLLLCVYAENGFNSSFLERKWQKKKLKIKYVSFKRKNKLNSYLRIMLIHWKNKLKIMINQAKTTSLIVLMLLVNSLLVKWSICYYMICIRRMLCAKPHWEFNFEISQNKIINRYTQIRRNFLILFKIFWVCIYGDLPCDKPLQLPHSIT